MEDMWNCFIRNIWKKRTFVWRWR